MSKVVLITGASSGIGEATAKKLVADGHKLIITARSKDKLDTIASALGEDNVLAVAADATQFEQLATVVKTAVDHFGRLDAVFANAGKGLNTAGTEAGDPDEWDTLIDLNVKALLWTAKITLPHLKKTTGHFLLTSSAAGRIPMLSLRREQMVRLWIRNESGRRNERMAGALHHDLPGHGKYTVF